MEMTSKKKVVVIFSSIILLIVVFVGYTFITSIYQEYRLKEEITNLTTLDITKDSFDTGTVTYGDYKVVEKSIKDYLNEYALNLQSINNIINDDKFNKLLSYDTLSKDEDFTESIQYVIDTKEEVNQYIDNLIDMCSEDKIKNNITKYHLNDYYVRLYNNLMLNEEVPNRLNMSKDYLDEYRNNINIKLDTCLEIFEFLKNNKENYVFEDNEIKFATQDLIDQYNGYIEKIKI